MNTTTTEVIDRGMQCLSTQLGAWETERFISTILREKFDYTEWRQDFVNGIKDFDDLDNLLKHTRNKAHFNGTPDTVL